MSAYLFVNIEDFIEVHNYLKNIDKSILLIIATGNIKRLNSFIINHTYTHNYCHTHIINNINNIINKNYYSNISNNIDNKIIEKRVYTKTNSKFKGFLSYDKLTFISNFIDLSKRSEINLELNGYF